MNAIETTATNVPVLFEKKPYAVRYAQVNGGTVAREIRNQKGTEYVVWVVKA